MKKIGDYLLDKTQIKALFKALVEFIIFANSERTIYVMLEWSTLMHTTVTQNPRPIFWDKQNLSFQIQPWFSISFLDNFFSGTYLHMCLHASCNAKQAPWCCNYNSEVALELHQLLG